MTKSKKTEELEQRIAELTADLQRTRADFENYSKRVDLEKQASRDSGRASAIIKLLPVIDTIERAVEHVPDELKEHVWVKGVAALTKQMEKTLDGLNLVRIDAKPGIKFNPELHEAVQFDDEADGEHEVIAEELQAGYTLAGVPIRHSMVRVTRQ